MRKKRHETASRRGHTTQQRRGDDVAPIGSITGKPVQVQISCNQFICVHIGYRWAPAGPANITNIVPAPTAAEKTALTNALFGANPMARLELPRDVEILPCLGGCTCTQLRWGAFTPNQIPQTMTKELDYVPPGGPPAKTFAITLVIAANVRQGVGRCEP